MFKSLTRSLQWNQHRLCKRHINICERKISVKGVEINYVQSGNGSDSVLLMPGALGSAWTDFRPQIEKLPSILPDFTIIAWDPPGYGKSIPPKRKFDLNFFQNDAEFAFELMKTLNRSNFSILGWSDGGITALILAANHQSSVEKLVIWGAGAYLTADEINDLENIRDVKKWSEKMRQPMEKLYGVDRFAELWEQWIDSMINFYKTRNGDLCKSEVEKVKAKTLIVHGKKDPMIAPEHIPYLRERIPSSSYYEFPDGKHNIHLRYAEDFNKLVTKFLL